MNKLLLTKADKAIIQEKLDRARSTLWKDSLFTNSKGILSDTLQSILSDENKGWPYFYKHIGKGYFQFSQPLFIGNGSYALLTRTHLVANSAGRNLLFVYKKEGTDWKWYIMMPLGAW